MDLTPSSKFQLRDLLRPGVVIGGVGMLLIAFCIVKYAWSNHGIDVVANPELATQGTSTVKTMVWMVCGVGLTLFGALLTFLDFTRKT